jgi:hypothetical protein
VNPLLLALVQAGVITQSDAERINRSLDPDAARAWAERRLVAGAQGGLSDQGERLAELVRSAGGNPSAARTAFSVRRLTCSVRPLMISDSVPALTSRRWAALRNEPAAAI